MAFLKSNIRSQPGSKEAAMNWKEIAQRAGELGIDPVKGVSKADLIRAIQTQEGNFPCYGTAAAGFCDQGLCCWREDCLADSQAMNKNPD
jgi:hypothetical protein